MGGLLFVSQAMLDTWAGQGKIDFVGNVMTLLAGAGQGRSYALEPAVRFLKVVGGDSDPNGLLKKVKGLAQLREMGAEPVGDSCILGDMAYEVEPGFLAEAAALQAAASAPRAEGARPPAAMAPPPAARPAAAPPAAPAAPPPPAVAPAAAVTPPRAPLGYTPLPRELEEKRKEAEALARFLLENLS
ncbi:MAG TPA: hypothetical protein VML50_00720 [Anaeromyxobacter sp.]|nr:hypothetical protein [Anaeromyxobacter sp.]